MSTGSKLVLGGDDKSAQSADIVKAVKLSTKIEEGRT